MLSVRRKTCLKKRGSFHLRSKATRIYNFDPFQITLYTIDIPTDSLPQFQGSGGELYTSTPLVGITTLQSHVRIPALLLVTLVPSGYFTYLCSYRNSPIYRKKHDLPVKMFMFHFYLELPDGISTLISVDHHHAPLLTIYSMI